PAVVEAVAAALPTDAAGTVVELGEEFGDSPAISIDHAVMERTDRAVVVPLDAGWTDVGSWNSVWEALAPEGGTVTSGEVLAVLGLDDVVVVETPEGVLVMDRRRSQDVRLAAEWRASRDQG